MKNNSFLPDSIGSLINLVSFSLNLCFDLQHLPDSIGSLIDLVSLSLKHCSSLTMLPESIGNLKSLTKLGITCTSTKRLPASIGRLENLQYFTARYLSELTEVPKEIGELCSLQTLDLSDCPNLKSMLNLPCSLTSLTFTADSMETLPNLTDLSDLKDLHYFDKFERWNRVLNFGSLNNLMSLRIYGSYSLHSSIENIELILELPSSLKELHLGYCPTLRALPSLSHCQMLSSLEITSCCNLSEIGDAVTYCTLSECNALERLPNLSSAKNLKSLVIHRCENLMEIQGLDGEVCLEMLKIHGCSSLERLGDLSCLKMLTELELINYEKLSDFDEIDKLSSLRKLKIIRCKPKTKSLDLSRHKNLRILILELFEILLEITMPPKLEYLEKLEISCCNSLDELPDFSFFTNLRWLIVKGFQKLPEIKGLPVSLGALDISGWKSLVNLPDISRCCYLQGMLSEGCNKLAMIKELEGQKELKILNFSGCKSLEGLLDFSLLEKLIHLSLNGCEKLTEIKGLPISLNSLDISGCNSLVNLPDLSCCCSLEVLLAGGCSKTGLLKLCYLEILDLSDCKSLEELLDFSLFKKLEHLCLNGCENLTEIKGLPVTLTTLDISRCKLLVNLPDFSKFHSLKGLFVKDCSNLEEFRGLECLQEFHVLAIRGCESLKRMPDLPNDCIRSDPLHDRREDITLNGKMTLRIQSKWDYQERWMCVVCVDGGGYNGQWRREYHATEASMYTEERKTAKSSSNDDDNAVVNDQITTSDASITDLPDGETYEVFLSFRGENTRKDFTDHLVRRLMNVGTWVFLDDEALRVGEEIGPELDKAIKASKISIPIISPNYASSKWCLKELVQILECKKTTSQVVLPIFYQVEPSSLRHQTGTFEKAFRLHEKKYGSNSKVVQEWRNALEEVAPLKGWESSKIADGRNGQLVDTVVTKVLNGLKKTTLNVTEHLVGMEDHKEKILKMVENNESSHAQVIVIHGMGGISKTTLARVIYNELVTKFDYCSFLPDIREKLLEEKCCPEELQKQLISNILGHQWQGEISNVDDGINIIKDRLKNEKVLILFDDVDHSNQLDALAREHSWFKSGSVLIITSRNKDVLKTWEGRLTYEPNELDASLSLLLFCRHAFRRDECPSVEFHAIAKNIVFTTGGLPLAIEVIGSMLLGKSKVYWEDAFKTFLMRMCKRS